MIGLIVPPEPAALLAGYISETEVAEQRGKSTRTLRSERRRGAGPPFVRDGRNVFYSVEGYRAWLKARERNPVVDVA